MTRRKRSRARHRKPRKWLYALPILAALLVGVGAAWLLGGRGDASPTTSEIKLAPVSQLSQKVRVAPPIVQEAYRFAIANPDVLAQLPCYCGCGAKGHESDLDCFVEAFNPDGSVTFGYHAYE
jgi:hypothetical protein